MPLHVEARGSGPPLIVLHGFTQTGRIWGRFGDLLATSHTLVAVDLPGHGESGTVRADLPATADLVAEAVRTAVGDEPCALLGYSLGARVALHVAIAAALPLRRLVFIGVTAGIEDPQAASDDASPTTPWLTSSRPRETWSTSSTPGCRVRCSNVSPGVMLGRAERLHNTAPGLASSLRLCGVGTQEPVWDRLPTLACPVLAMAGSDDVRFASHALRVARLVPQAVVSLVPGGGHAAHLAQPEQTGRIVRHWLGDEEPGRT